MFLTVINAILSLGLVLFAIDTSVKVYESNYLMLLMSLAGALAYTAFSYLFHMDDASDVRFNWRQWILIAIGSYIVSVLLVHFTVEMTYSI